MSNPPPASTIYLPADDAVAVWAERGALRPTVSYREMMHGEHAAAFTVAKIAKLELLTAVRASLDEVIRNGGTFEAWKRDLLPHLQRAGWWGVVNDPELTGTTDTIVVGDRRLRTIYRTNIRMSIAGGRWRKFQREKALFPYLRYLSDHYRKHPRLNHKGWHGIILPIDDPTWQWMFPPNGWGCNCRTEQVSEGGLRRNGWSVSKPPDPGTKPFASPSGTINVPNGIAPGFGYNPGTAHLRVLADKAAASIAQALAVGEDAAAQITLRQILDDAALEQFLALPQTRMPMAILPAEDAALIGARTRLAILSDADQRKQLTRASEGDLMRLRADTYRPIATIADAFTMRGQQGAGTLLYALRRDDGRYLCVVMQRTASGAGLFIKSVRVQSEGSLARFFRDATDVIDRRR